MVFMISKFTGKLLLNFWFNQRFHNEVILTEGSIRHYCGPEGIKSSVKTRAERALHARAGP